MQMKVERAKRVKGWRRGIKLWTEYQALGIRDLNATKCEESFAFKDELGWVQWDGEGGRTPELSSSRHVR